MTRSTLLVLALAACTEPKLREFSMPRNIEDVRGRMLVHVEGHPIDEARGFLREHGFECDAPLPSATDARAHLCHAVAAPADAGWRNWTLVLLERGGRVADLMAR